MDDDEDEDEDASDASDAAVDVCRRILLGVLVVILEGGRDGG